MKKTFKGKRIGLKNIFTYHWPISKHVSWATIPLFSQKMENILLHYRFVYPCVAFKREIWKKIGSCLPLHLNLSSRIESIFRFCALFGDSHLAPDVSMGCAWRYAFSHRRLQSQMNGFLAKCLWRNGKILSHKNPLFIDPRFFRSSTFIPLLN